MHALQGLEADGDMEENLALFSIELAIHQQMGLMAWLFGFKVRPESARGNPTWGLAESESFSRRCQMVVLHPDCFSGHGEFLTTAPGCDNGKVR
jgi:hypothetical protein